MRAPAHGERRQADRHQQSRRAPDESSPAPVQQRRREPQQSDGRREVKSHGQQGSQQGDSQTHAPDPRIGQRLDGQHQRQGHERLGQGVEFHEAGHDRQRTTEQTATHHQQSAARGRKAACEPEPCPDRDHRRRQCDQTEGGGRIRA